MSKESNKYWYALLKMLFDNEKVVFFNKKIIFYVISHTHIMQIDDLIPLCFNLHLIILKLKKLINKRLKT